MIDKEDIENKMIESDENKMVTSRTKATKKSKAEETQQEDQPTYYIARQSFNSSLLGDVVRDSEILVPNSSHAEFLVKQGLIEKIK